MRKETKPLLLLDKAMQWTGNMIKNVKKIPCAVFTISIIMTLLLTNLNSLEQKKLYNMRQLVEAQKLYNTFNSNFEYLLKIFHGMQSYYETDRQVTFDEFAKFIETNTTTKKFRENNLIKYASLGWYSNNRENPTHIEMNDSWSEVIISDDFIHPELINIHSNELNPTRLYKGYKLIKNSVNAKEADPNETRDGFFVDGVFFILIDVKGLVKESFQKDDRFQYEILDINQNQNDKLIIIPLSHIDPNVALNIISNTNWQFISKDNISSLIVLIVGFILSFLLAFYVWFLLLQNKKLISTTNKAEELSRLKSDFLATMSHEIRTPMNGILGMAELIQSAQPSIQIQGYARTIINSGESLQHIINDILDFSKIEAGKIEIENMPVNLLDLTEEIGKLYAVKARQKAIELVIHFVPGTEQNVFTDPVRLRQILGNLISNAIKFTDKGHVCLIIEEVNSKQNTFGTVEIKFSVTDTGIGLSEDIQLHIFDKFVQGDNSKTRKYGGTGLGLAICKNLIELMGGQIWLESEVNQGSKFNFTLALACNNITATAPQQIGLDIKNVKILLVDDLMVIRELVKEHLLYSGIRCDAVSNGNDALSSLNDAYHAGDPYHIVILDYLMPEMNGEMVAKAIKDIEHLKNTCLIMLTAAGNPLANDHFVKHGFSAYIPKPISNESFIKSLALIWERYSHGEIDSLIQIDTTGYKEESEPKNEYNLDGINILVAEDNLVNQVFITETLNEMNVKTTIASNGILALEAVKNNDFRLIIMDCSMPEMDGWEASKAIKQLQNNGEISPAPILALTANAMKGDREKCLSAGMDDYLTKPVRKAVLKEAVYDLITNYTLHKLEKKIVNNSIPSKTLDLHAIENAKSILKTKYKDMIYMYVENSQQRINEISNAVQTCSLEDIIMSSHTLKSTSQQMGALHLSELAKKIEHAGKIIKADLKNSNFETFLKGIKINELEQVLSDTKIALSKTISHENWKE